MSEVVAPNAALTEAEILEAIEAATQAFERGELEAAEATLRVAAEAAPEHEAVLDLRIRVILAAQDWPALLARCEALRAIKPRNSASYIFAMRALDELGRRSEGDTCVEQANELIPDDVWVASVWADRPAGAGDWALSVARWRDVQSRFPESEDCVLPALRLLQQHGQAEAAEAMAAAAARRMPGSITFTTFLADAAMERRDWPAAVGLWASIRATDADGIKAFIGGSKALDRLGLTDEADFLLEQAMRRNPADETVATAWAQRAETRGDRAEADRRWRQVREAQPDNVAACWAELHSAIRDGDIKRARSLRLAAVERFGDRFQIDVGWANEPIADGDWDETLRRWEVLLSIGETGAEAPLATINGLIEAGYLSAADAMIERIRMVAAESFDVARTWGHLAMRRELWSEAAARWEVVRQAFPDAVEGWLEGGRALGRAGRERDAFALLIDGRGRFPDNPQLLIGWAELADLRQDWTESQDRWSMVRERFPDEPRGWVGLASAMDHVWRHQDAIALLDEGIARLPDSFDVMFYWALISGRNVEKDIALERWTRVRTTFPDHLIGFVFSAHAFFDHGLPTEAEALAAELMSRHPDQPEVLRLWAELAVRRGDLAQAAERYEQCLNRSPADLGLVRAQIDTLLSLQRHDEARIALRNARARWPYDASFLRQLLMQAVNQRNMDEAMPLWRELIASPAIDQRTACELGWAMAKEGLEPDQIREVLVFLGRETGTGGRDWLPVIADLEKARGLRPELLQIGIELMRAPEVASFDPATRDVFSSCLLIDASDDDYRRYFDTYALGGRRALLAKLFCQNYWKPRPHRLADMKRVFDTYIQEKLSNPDWLAGAGARALLSLLNCAAVWSPHMYRRLVHEGRQRLNVDEMARETSMRTVEGAVGSLLTLAPDSAQVPEMADEPLIRMEAPTLLSVPQRLRIAVCVSGQLRGFERAFPTWAKLGLDRHDTTYFVHTWQDVGRNWQRIWNFTRRNPFLWNTFARSNSIGLLEQQFPKLLAASRVGGEVDVKRLSEFYGTNHVRVEDDRVGVFFNKTNSWKMFYKIEQAHKLARTEGGDFDLMIRVRPDRAVDAVDEIDWREIQWRSGTARTLFVDEEYIFTENHTWLADQLAVGTPALMDVYSGVFSDLNRMIQTNTLPLDVANFFLAHANLFYLMFYRGILGRTLPHVKLGGLLDPAMLSPADVLHYVRQDTAERALDEFDRQLIAACEEEIAARAG